MKWIQPDPKQNRYVNLERTCDVSFDEAIGRITFYFQYQASSTFQFCEKEEAADAWQMIRRLLGYIEHEMVREQSYRDGLCDGKPVVMTPLPVSQRVVVNEQLSTQSQDLARRIEKCLGIPKGLIEVRWINRPGPSNMGKSILQHRFRVDQQSSWTDYVDTPHQLLKEISQ